MYGGKQIRSISKQPKAIETVENRNEHHTPETGGLTDERTELPVLWLQVLKS
jgi:hypothetical protein